MVKSVLLAQLSEEQSLIWHKALSSHQLEVWAAPETDLLKLLDQKRHSKQSLPHLIISDIGIRYGGGTSLLATELCKWCADHAPELQVLLVNPRQSQIKEVEKRWAIRRGAIDLLPKISLDNLSSAFEIAAQALAIAIKPEALKNAINSLKLQQYQPDKGAVKGKNIRQTATEVLARKMAMIPLMVMASEPDMDSSSNDLSSQNPKRQLALDSTISELNLYNHKIDLSQTGEFARQLFKDDPILPALIIYDQDKYVGMLSRRRFLECLSRPYALELFTKRPLRVLYEQLPVEILELHGNISIVMASQLALARSNDEIYEPVIVRLEEDTYSILDVHDLLLEQSRIHELATKLLREQTQTTMFQTEKMASLGQIVAEVSHDIRNPVSAIYGNTECLLNYIEGVMKILRAYEKEYGTSATVISETLEAVDWDFVRSDLPQVVKSIQSGAKYLRRLVDTLQSLSHMEDHANPEIISLIDCVESSLTILSGRIRNVQVVKNYIDLPKVNGYSDRLIQVFMNLISNALDALVDLKSHPDLITQRKHLLSKEDSSDERGNVQTDLEMVAWQPLVMITSAIAEIDNRNWISIKIADNGMGIPKEIQDRIFDNFFTTKGQGHGTGLGLAICHQIITQQHNGKVVLRSPYLNNDGDVTIGTEFEVLLPISK